MYPCVLKMRQLEHSLVIARLNIFYSSYLNASFSATRIHIKVRDGIIIHLPQDYFIIKLQ